MKKVVSILAGLVLSLTIASSAMAQSLPFSFSGPSSFARGPDRLTFGFMSPFCSDCRTVAGSGGGENIHIGSALGLMVAATWLSAAAQSSSSAPALAYTIGLEHTNADVNAFEAGGWLYPTYGSSTFTGVFVGAAFETPLGGGYSSSSIAVPTFGFGLNLGYGWAGVDGFGGSFQANESGIYGRADAYMAIPMAGGVLLTPGVSYRIFDFGGIEESGLSGFLRLVIPL
ncbi:hypothetical protein [Nioella aestuarii]|uniref:hypothetical protein n=1 Tax=Nioella aestuarii TaxID=1662864 RepID=UPI003D7FC2A7